VPPRAATSSSKTGRFGRRRVERRRLQQCPAQGIPQQRCAGAARQAKALNGFRAPSGRLRGTRVQPRENSPEPPYSSARLAPPISRGDDVSGSGGSGLPLTVRGAERCAKGPATMRWHRCSAPTCRCIRAGHPMQSRSVPETLRKRLASASAHAAAASQPLRSAAKQQIQTTTETPRRVAPPIHVRNAGRCGHRRLQATGGSRPPPQHRRPSPKASEGHHADSEIRNGRDRNSGRIISDDSPAPPHTEMAAPRIDRRRAGSREEMCRAERPEMWK